ncbi:hypothetical protein SAICODRAFT_114863 [Saitoella complicata NRRL Y-17804]|uniref:uncharacterized protein n=1 Tax=Saitoella complicata (strain BCRC 22490 / CBS 7301 / JCM 7358 / NBRC 10748 / NRRL Y-17804) TaxID=698492 RepID=UPI000867D8E8|nr:uncharacterized protein SAICODRAFT_114863 [Saitoella complicata NRRL Y-17804]ODQ53443.1 hypothetical protein SAICODRAFT_114863 [Saitoella complicata NRRL Y-17804]
MSGRLSSNRSSVAIPRRPVPVVVTDQTCYTYALRVAFLAYLLHPNTRAERVKIAAVNASTVAERNKPSRTATALDSMNELVRTSTGVKEKEGKNKFPKDLVKILKTKLEVISMGKDPQYQDPLVRATFAGFYAHYTEPGFYKQVKENRKIEELVMIFISSATAVLKKRLNDDHEAKEMVNQHVVLFVRLIRYTMKTNHLASSAPDLMQRLENYETKLMTNSRVGHEPGVQPGAPLTISYNIRDMPMVQTVIKLFSVPEYRAQQEIDALKGSVNEQTAINDMKARINNINANSPAVLQEDDFQSEEAYQQWKTIELKQLSQMISDMIEGNPELTLNPNGEAVSTLLSNGNGQRRSASDAATNPNRLSMISNGGDMDRVRRTHGASKSIASMQDLEGGATLVPPDPKRFYRHLMEMCLSRDLALKLSGENPDAPMISRAHSELLVECCQRWRMLQAYRVASFLDAIKTKFVDGEVGLEVVDEAFHHALTMHDGDFESWCFPDHQLYSQALLRFSEALMRMLYDQIQHAFDTKAPKPGHGYVLHVLNEYILEDPVFKETGAPMKEYIQHLEHGVRQVAIDRYNSHRQKLLEVQDSVMKVSNHVDAVTADMDRVVKRYKHDKILECISVLEIVVKTTALSFALDLRNLILEVDLDARTKGLEVPLDDMLVLFGKVQPAVGPMQHLCPESDIAAVVEESFRPYVHAWLNVTEAKTPEWVDRAISMDKFQSENPDEPGHSSSVVDLFDQFWQAVGFLKDLEWPDEYQDAKFRTRLAKAFSLGIAQYCKRAEELFTYETTLKPAAEQEATSSAQPNTERWMAMARNAIRGRTRVEPFNFAPESCVKINNIEYVQKKMEAIAEALDVETMAMIIEEREPQKPRSSHEKATFTIKIISGEDLKPCDRNGLSDPYVVLSDEHGRRVAKTRTIYKSLNPRWDQSFDVDVKGLLWLRATVWDADVMGDHDICGSCYLKLDPRLFGDYVPREQVADLDTQGRLLLRISMEGEKDDILFYFGKVFRSLHGTENAMTRIVVDKMTAYIQECLSRQVLKSLLSRPVIDVDKVSLQMSNLFSRAGLRQATPQPEPAPAKVGLTKQDMESAIDPLFDYLDANFAVLAANLTESAIRNIMSKVWHEVLTTIEDLLVPPLSEKPSSMRPLNEAEVDVVYNWLNFLRDFFHHGGEGVPMDVLTQSKYQEVVSIRFFYDQDLNTLVQEAERTVQTAMARRQEAAAHETTSATGGKLNSRNLGTIKAKRQKQVKDLQSSDDIILRIMRMREGCERVLYERFRQRSRLQQQLIAEETMKMSNRR